MLHLVHVGWDQKSQGIVWFWGSWRQWTHIQVWRDNICSWWQVGTELWILFKYWTFLFISNAYCLLPSLKFWQEPLPTSHLWAWLFSPLRGTNSKNSTCFPVIFFGSIPLKVHQKLPLWPFKAKHPKWYTKPHLSSPKGYNKAPSSFLDGSSPRRFVLP